MVGRQRVRALVTFGAAFVGAVGCGSSRRSAGGGAGAVGGSSLAGANASGAAGTGGASASGGDGGRGGAGGSSGGATGTSGLGGSAGGDTGGDVGERSGGTSGEASGSSGRAGNSAGGSAGTSEGGSAGTSTAGGSGGSSGGTPSVDCSGAFGEPRVVFELEIPIESPTLSSDETELLFATSPVTNYVEFHRATRASKLDAFGPSEPISGLDGACSQTPQGSIDLGADGFRAYVVCYDPRSVFGGDLRMAQRTGPDSFDLVSLSGPSSVGANAAVSRDEATLYSSSLNLGADPPLVFKRDAPFEPFNNGVAIPGLEDLPYLSPDPTPDGLSLYVSLAQSREVLVATRASVGEPFSELDVVASPPDADTTWSSPTISEDCRSLYAVRLVLRSSGPAWTLEVFTR